MSAREARDSSRVVSCVGHRVVVTDPVEGLTRQASMSSLTGGDTEALPLTAWHREFVFDASYEGDGGDAVYQDIGVPLVKQAWAGYDSSLFAYGQTGAGKTYSMLGGPGEPGLIPRVCAGLFEAIEASAGTDDVRVEASFMEIYNEGVRDLLLPTGRPLRVREHPQLGAHVPDLTTVRVTTADEIAALAEVGSRARATAATRANGRSSRSHAVFTLSVERRRIEEDEHAGWWSSGEAWSRCTTRARLRLVDLAGSERVATTGTDGARLREAKSINKSLATLCDVIEALGANASKISRLYGGDDGGGDTVSVRASRDEFSGPNLKFVPYRNSTLTWLLKDSLSGNAFVSMLACISPAETHYEETLATLKYAERARRVRTRPPAQLVGEAVSESATSPRKEDDDDVFRAPSARNSPARGPSARKTWPNLTNLNPDPEFAGRRIWPLSDAVTLVGSGPAATVRLRGKDVLSEHAIVAATNRDQLVVLVGLDGSTCHVDGRLLDTRDRCDVVRLNHGSRVVFGLVHAFRFEAERHGAADDPTAEWTAAQRELLQRPAVRRLKLDEPPPKFDVARRHEEDYEPPDPPSTIPSPAATPRVPVDHDLAATKLRMDIAQAQCVTLLCFFILLQARRYPGRATTIRRSLTWFLVLARRSACRLS